MKKPLTQKEIARRRVIQRFRYQDGKGEIMLCGRTFNLACDDLLDLAQALEMIALKLTGKVLREKFRPAITNRAALLPTRIAGGDYDDYDSKGGPPPVTNYQVCDVTDIVIRTSYLCVEIEGNRWDNWFGRLDELLKCLYAVIREAQGDPYERPIREVVRAPVQVHAANA